MMTIGKGLTIVGGGKREALRDGFGLEDDERLVATFLAGAVSKSQRTNWRPAQMKVADPSDPIGARAWLSQRLRDHMIPSGFALLEALPLMPTGKLDRKALPDIDVASGARAAYEAPRGPMEVLVARAFEELLSIDEAGRTDNFFDLGGHSLMATRLAAKLEAETGRGLRHLFEGPTVAGIAKTLENAEEGMEYAPLIQAPKVATVKPLASVRMLCFHAMAGHGAPYLQPAVIEALLSFGQVTAVQSRGHMPGEVPFESYGEMVDCYVDAVLALNDDLPLVFIGWSGGGHLAHDVASKLAEHGRQVSGLAYLDSIDGVTFSGTDQDDVEAFENFGKWAAIFAETVRAGGGERLNAIEGEQEKAVVLWGELDACGMIPTSMAAAFDAEAAERFFKVFYQNNKITIERSASAHFPGPALVIRTNETAAKTHDPSLGWADVCDNLTTEDVDFRHLDFLNASVVPEVFGIIADWMEKEFVK